MYERSFSIDEKVYGNNHPEIATDLNNLAGLYESQGRYSEAEPLYKRALAIAEVTLGAEHPTTVICRNNYEGLREHLQR